MPRALATTSPRMAKVARYYPINNQGVKLTADALQFHSGSESNWSGYPAIITYGDVNAMYGWAIKSGSGTSFSLDSLSFLDWGNFNGATFAISAYEDNKLKGTVNFKGNMTADFVRLNNAGLLTPAFKSVDEVRIYQLDGRDSYISLNNIKVSSSVVTATNDALLAESISVFPNPTEGVFSLVLKSNARVTVSNTQGKVVFDELLASGNSSIDLGSETSGIYVLKVTGGRDIFTTKFVKK
jgi:hypothetical protein